MAAARRGSDAGVTRLSWVQSEGVGTIIGPSGRELATYDHSNAKNHPYLSHVRPVNHDGILTATAPWDHRWHHGLWWSWKFLNDVLYWEDHEGYGGNRIGLGRSSVTSHETGREGDHLVIRNALDWSENATGDVVLTEERRMTIGVASDTVWFLDWDLRWTAQRHVVLDTTPYPEHWWGGYGGLNYRAARSMAADEAIQADGQRSGRTAVHAEAMNWAAYSGKVDGSGADEPNDPAFGGVAIVPHPENPWQPTPAYVFSAQEEFGFLAAAPLLHQQQTLVEGDDLRLCYRTLIFGTRLDDEQLDELSGQYARPN
jgi:hypothetical protein